MLGGNLGSLLYGDVSVMRGVEGLVRGGGEGGSGGCKPRIEGIVKWGLRVQSGGSECMCK